MPNTLAVLQQHLEPKRCGPSNYSVFVTQGENDRQIPLKYAHQTYEQLVNIPKKDLFIFTVREGGVEHSSLDNPLNADNQIADCLAERLSGSVA